LNSIAENPLKYVFSRSKIKKFSAEGLAPPQNPPMERNTPPTLHTLNAFNASILAPSALYLALQMIFLDPPGY
jgi:hypothetical protein